MTFPASLLSLSFIAVYPVRIESMIKDKINKMLKKLQFIQLGLKEGFIDIFKNIYTNCSLSS